MLVVAALPAWQRVADAIAGAGLSALGLPETYPVDASGTPVPRARCQSAGAVVHSVGLSGVHCRSAAVADGSGRELAWFPSRRSPPARAIGAPVPFHAWWVAADLEGVL